MRTLLKNRYILLFASIILFLVVPSFINQPPFLKFVIISILLTIILFQSVIVVLNNKKYVIIGLFFGVSSIVFNWIAYYYPYDIKILLAIADSLTFMYFAFIIVLLISHLVKTKEVNADCIIIASSIYFLMGIIGGILCELLYHLYPNSFLVTREITLQASDFIYFSFTTLTTLGYGDITPTIPQTEILTVLLSVAGQLYLTIIVALLIGTYIIKRR